MIMNTNNNSQYTLHVLRSKTETRNDMKQKIFPAVCTTTTTFLHLLSPKRGMIRAILARLPLFCLFCYLSIGTVSAKEFQRITKEEEEQQQSLYQNEPAYGEQAWIFDTINVLEAWNMGYTGRQTRVRINDFDWESDHPEWTEATQNAEEKYSCGDPNNKSPILYYDDEETNDSDKYSDSDSKNNTLHHGAAVASILAADGNNNFCGTGIAPKSTLSFCNFQQETTNATVLMYHVVAQELNANTNWFDISINAFAYEGCSSEPRETILGLHRKNQDQSTDQLPSRRRLQQKEEEQQQEVIIETCPFLKFYEDEHNPGDDPCRVCTKSDFDAVDAGHKRDNIFQVASEATISKTEGDGTGIAGVSETCATSVRAYCSRNFRRDDALCTEWIEVINKRTICRFKSGVGKENNYALDRGAKEGRWGKGAIYIFAAGDSYGSGDSVNFQAYPKSRFVMTVGAVKVKEVTTGSSTTTLQPIHSTYSTSGSSIFVVAPGGDYDSPYRHVGAGGGNTCVDIGYGTSFAAPVVGGVVALMLEAHTYLSWRDVRAIIAATSKPVEILDNKGNNDDATFGINAAGVGYSELYGFGLIDATAAVKEAKNWKNQGRHVPRELGITARSGVVNLDIKDDSFFTSTSKITIDGNEYNNNYVLESVSVYLKLRYFNR